jgi:cell division protein FtsB
MSERRRGGPGGSRRPEGRTPRGAAARPRPLGAAPAPFAPRTPARRPRLTGRAAVLVLVVAVLTVSYGSSLKAYLQQRSQIAELKAQIAERQANIDALEREKRRWDDPAYVQAQARERFGYLMPGETAYVVLDADGNPLETGATLRDPAEVVKEEPTAWWSTAWASMELAGHPPTTKQDGKPPVTEIDGTRQ